MGGETKREILGYSIKFSGKLIDGLGEAVERELLKVLRECQEISRESRGNFGNVREFGETSEERASGQKSLWF